VAPGAAGDGARQASRDAPASAPSGRYRGNIRNERYSENVEPDCLSGWNRLAGRKKLISAEKLSKLSRPAHSDYLGAVRVGERVQTVGRPRRRR
jgi:hypothetical protein